MKARPLLWRIVPAASFAAFSVITLLIAVGEGFLPVAIALAGSSLVFIVGVLTGEADILYLAWLDQGSNLILIEVESSAASVLSVTVTVVAVLLLADLAHVTELFGRHWAPGGILRLWSRFPRLVIAGSVAGFLGVAGIALSPVFTVVAGQVLFVAVLAVVAIAIIAAAGSSDS